MGDPTFPSYVKDKNQHPSDRLDGEEEKDRGTTEYLSALSSALLARPAQIIGLALSP